MLCDRYLYYALVFIEHYLLEVLFSFYKAFGEKEANGEIFELFLRAKERHQLFFVQIDCKGMFGHYCIIDALWLSLAILV